ncbi:MAG: AMP-binding protein, partial [Rhizobacter sp.]
MDTSSLAFARSASIVECLARWRERTPDRHALHVLRDGEQVERSISYRELHDTSLQVAQGLRRRCAPKGRVLLLLPNDFSFVASFYGCLAAGLVAIPAYHPQQPKKVGQWKKLQAIAENSGASLIIAPPRSAEVLAAMQANEGLFRHCQLETCDGLLAAGAGATDALPRPSASDLAFLQYTSGSTGAPKGVMITHDNILRNQEVIASLMGNSAATRVVSWLPLYHDMGLSAVLQMGSVGCSVVLMSPADFIQKPLRWMKAISEHRAQTSGGPNFAYRLAAAALQSPEAAGLGLDLSSWDLAFCGAEPIQRDTVSEFVGAAATHGFDGRAFFSCYGLAEATVMVTGVAKGSGLQCLEVNKAELAQGAVRRAEPSDPNAKALVACGTTAAGHEVRIVAADGTPVAGDAQVGEVWVRGPSVGAGYYGNAEATDA